MLTSWTTKNPERRFFRCNSSNGGCTYFEWLDEGMSERARDVINQFVSEKMELARRIEEMEKNYFFL
ncbi:hypothetical protein Scep_006694 [Stephania cephalantha]|uniref:GRF-type domain-containing protein n=1 Tax=Stephania cephalantha TaxID=152367 RepID=A0AAP0PL27_9MAGN